MKLILLKSTPGEQKGCGPIFLDKKLLCAIGKGFFLIVVLHWGRGADLPILFISFWVKISGLLVFALEGGGS